MKKILASIADYYKHIYQQMGKWGFLGLCAIIALFTFGGIKDFIQYGETLILFIVGFLVIVYHIVFIIDKKKTEKRLKRHGELNKK